MYAFSQRGATNRPPRIGCASAPVSLRANGLRPATTRATSYLSIDTPKSTAFHPNKPHHPPPRHPSRTKMDPPRRHKRPAEQQAPIFPPLLPAPRALRITRPPSPLRHPPKRPRSVAAPPRPIPPSPKPALARAAPREGHAPPPRTFECCAAMFTTFAPRTPAEKADAARLAGAPRLSALALSAARVGFARGRLMDLSRVADDYVYNLLASPAITPGILAQLEACNPSRVNVFEALWARLVAEKFDKRELPDGVVWWRGLYEKITREAEVSLQRTAERLRMWYSAGDQERKKRSMETTKRIRLGDGRRRRGGASAGGVQSRISRLREEVRREKKRR